MFYIFAAKLLSVRYFQLCITGTLECIKELVKIVVDKVKSL